MSLNLAHAGPSWETLVCPLADPFPSLHFSIFWSHVTYELKWNCKLEYAFLCIIWLHNYPLSHWTSDVILLTLIYYWWQLNTKDCKNVYNINHSSLNMWYRQCVLKWEKGQLIVMVQANTCTFGMCRKRQRGGSYCLTLAWNAKQGSLGFDSISIHKAGQKIVQKTSVPINEHVSLCIKVTALSHMPGAMVSPELLGTLPQETV